jgi:hypothetical protein
MRYNHRSISHDSSRLSRSCPCRAAHAAGDPARHAASRRASVAITTIADLGPVIVDGGLGVRVEGGHVPAFDVIDAAQ